MTCWLTLKLVVVVTFASLVIGLSTALLVNNRFRGRTIARFGRCAALGLFPRSSQWSSLPGYSTVPSA